MKRNLFLFVLLAFSVIANAQSDNLKLKDTEWKLISYKSNNMWIDSYNNSRKIYMGEGKYKVIHNNKLRYTGKYTLDGENYNERIEWSSNGFILNTHSRYNMVLQADTMFISGLYDNVTKPLSERWILVPKEVEVAVIEPNKNEIAKVAVKETIAEEVKYPENREIKIRKTPIIVKNTENVSIDIWDSQTEDGDIVSLYINDVCVLNNYALVKKKKNIDNLPLKSGNNRVVLFAQNLGSIPPNTATISLFVDGKQRGIYVFESDLKSSEALEIIVEQN